MTNEMTTEKVKFVNANTVKLPFIELSGYKDHSRNGGFNRQTAKNDFQTFVLGFDRDVEFFVDSMDVDETNLALASANIVDCQIILLNYIQINLFQFLHCFMNPLY